MKRFATIYAAVTAIFVLGIVATFYIGQALFAHGVVTRHPAAAAPLGSGLAQNLRDPLAQLLVQFVVILLATRTAGTVLARLGQPAVIGEMLAGILLGPSLLGWLSPRTFAVVLSSQVLRDPAALQPDRRLRLHVGDRPRA
jgi:hypothetical protein